MPNQPPAKRPFPQRAIQLDFHTMPGIHDIGRDFDADEFADTLQSAGVEYINVFARCNLGFAYYPTKIGIVYPGLKVDLLGRMVSACHRRKIQVVAYFNAGLDHEHALRHRDWCKVNRDGQVYEMNQMGHFFRRLCLNTGYRPHLLAMVAEVMNRYPVDGFFLDCFSFTPCYGVECLDGMRRLGMDPMDDRAVTDYCWRITELFVKEVQRLVKPRGLNLYCNGVPYDRQSTHIELEVLPTGGWGYDVLPFVIRYARTLGKPYYLMTGRFHESWGDFCGLRPEPSLQFDCYNSIANGGTCSVGDHLHPRGKLIPAVYRTIRNVFAETARLDPWTANARPLTEMAILAPPLKNYPGRYDFSLESIQGATRILVELKQQFDIIDGDAALARYRVILLPDQMTVDQGLRRKLTDHLWRGGMLISSAYAGMNPKKTGFALGAYRLAFQGPEPYTPTFFKTAREVSRDLPDMLVTIYDPGIAMQARKGAKVLAELWKPYFNVKSWDRYHENLYTPPEKSTGRPALVRCGNVFHFSFPIFASYFEHAVVAYKHLLRNCLEQAFPRPLVKVEGFPSFGQATVTVQGKRRMVHLLTYVPELRGKRAQIVEEPIEVRDVRLDLRKDGRPVHRVYRAPGREPLDFESDDGYLTTTVPLVRGYQMVVFEE